MLSVRVAVSLVLTSASFVGVCKWSPSAPLPIAVDSAFVFEAELFCSGDSEVIQDEQASGGKYVRPNDDGTALLEFKCPESIEGRYEVGIAYRTTGSRYSVRTTFGAESTSVNVPTTGSFQELVIFQAVVTGSDTFLVQVGGNIDVDYCYIVQAAQDCDGCVVALGDTWVLDNSDGSGTEVGDTPAGKLSKFNSSNHTFQPNSSGGYDAIGDVDPPADDAANGGIAAGTGAAAGIGFGGAAAANTALATAIASNPVGWVIGAGIGVAAIGCGVYTLLEELGDSVGVNFKVTSYSLKVKKGTCVKSGQDCTQQLGCSLILNMVMAMPDATNGSPDGDNEVLTTTNNHDETSVGTLVPGPNNPNTLTINETATADCGDLGYILLEWGDGDNIVDFKFRCIGCY